MVKHTMKKTGSPTPPWFAKTVFRYVVSDEWREQLLGDLEEEFTSLQKQSGRTANRWYWRQLMTSLPYLIRQRCIFLKLFRTAAQSRSFAIAAGALMFVSLWDAWIAQRTAWKLSVLMSTENLNVIRGLYLAVLAAGFTACGAIITWLHCQIDSAYRQTRRYLMLSTVCLLSLSAIATIIQAPQDLLILRSIQWIVTIQSLLTSMIVTHRFLLR